ncbi:MAG: MG2 domain-containing protein, partial [Bacteroidota bacterium]
MRKSKSCSLHTSTFVLLFSCFFLYSCKQEIKTKADSAFKVYIMSFTSGTISKEGTVRVSLQSDVAKPEELNTSIEKNVFEFSPAIKGTAVWVDSRTIEFRPAEAMKPGTTYNAAFRLASVMQVPQKFSKFNFDFKIITQSFEVTVDGLHPLDNQNFNRQYLNGNIGTADVEDGAKVEKILTATQNDRVLPITWTQSGDRLMHAFRVDSIIRSEDSSAVKLSWDGKSIAVNLTGEQMVTVPALGDFILTNTRVVQQESEQYLLLEFSDPLQENQNLQGLITLGGMKDLKFTIEDNTIRVYPTSRQSSTLTLVLDAGIKNGLGKNLKEEVRQNILFEEIKPAVRVVGKGVILPSSEGLVFPFEAVNLGSVDVNIVKIFGDNTAQFFQVNDMEGQNEIARVGKSVLKKTIALSSIKKTDLSKWNRFTLDLADLTKTDPGCIYRVTLSFKKKYSLYKCTSEDTSSVNSEAEDTNWDEDEQKESSSWDFADEYYDEEGDYNWRDRDDPCKNSYYTSSRWASRNLLSSDFGIIAKKGMDGSLLFAVTDLNTTQPQSGVTLETYNYQQQLIDKKETGNDGLARVSLSQKPFLLIAKKGSQRGYLKLDDGSSLSLSMFDVAGEKVQKGLKGFIYGERGVWRPGDSLYVMFMLEDKQHSLPQSHPVTFELFNPQGQLTNRIVRTESMNGFYSFLTATDEEAPTGSWEAKVKVGSATFSKTIRIESIMPNHLKIKFDFAKKYLSKDEKQTAKMEVKWLHGAVARNLKADVEVTLTSSKTSFSKYSEFNFDDPTRTFSADKQQLFEGSVDENGKANVEADIEVENAAPGMLQANFVTKVFEPGGNFSIDRFSIPYHPYDEYVGLRVPKGDKARGMLLTDTNHVIQIVTLDKTGNLLPIKRKIEIEFYQVQWKWWWDKSEEDMSNFSSSSYNHLVKRDTISTENGIANWNLRLNYPNWGRYILRVHDLESGHYSGKFFYMDWPGWAGRGQRENQGSATMLSFSSDKDKYIVGDQVKLAFPSGKNSRALISIESGTKVIKSYWAQGVEGETQFSFPVTPDMTPNVYVNITLLQPHSQTVNDLPIRMFGVIPILVENPGTHIQPVITMQNVLRPEEPVSISIKEQQGKPMTYTVAVVDEGLLDLTRFPTPDPWNNFYAREALGVKTWDMFDYVMGAWGAQLERMLNIGGDEGLSKPKDGSKANRFKPVVKFMGPFHLAKGESQTKTFVMPQYVGSVRTMVIAGEDGAYGFAEKVTPVRKPLMVLATLPRVLGPEE